jgi:hypothetical protein
MIEDVDMKDFQCITLSFAKEAYIFNHLIILENLNFDWHLE